MAENLQETKPPEPPPKPPEVPKPTERPNRAETAGNQLPTPESQTSAQLDARNGAQSELAKATNGVSPGDVPQAQPVTAQNETARAQRETPRAQPESSPAESQIDPLTAARDRPTTSPHGEQASAQADARHSAAAEHAKATSPQAAEGEIPRNQAVPGDAAGTSGNSPRHARIEQNGAQVADGDHLDPAGDLRGRVEPPVEDTPGSIAGDDNSGISRPGRETDQSPETAARLQELRDEGHGPQRHHDPTETQLMDRLGKPVVDEQTGLPELNNKGFVKGVDQVDPMTGTTVDAVTGDPHKCGDFATRFDSGDDFVAADQYMRQQIGDSGPTVKTVPINDVLGPSGHDRLTGFYRDPANPDESKPVDFEGGTIFAAYKRAADGSLTLTTMYANPDPFNPKQRGGIQP